jgi:CBS domain-containing protein
MKVQDVMSGEVRTCRPETNLAEAAMQMWQYDCGALPVVTNENKVIGMVTDRDIAIAVGTKGRPAAAIPVREIISGTIYTALLDEDIHTALRMMRHEKVRRLPVTNREGMLQGILSLNDIVLRAEEEKGRRHPELNYEDAMSTLKAVCEHRPAQQAAGSV